MYVYYDVEDNDWYLSSTKEKWLWYDREDTEHVMDMDYPSDDLVIPFDVAERWVWGRMNIPNFDIFVLTVDGTVVKGWGFIIPSKEDTMHFKLRWDIT